MMLKMNYYIIVVNHAVHNKLSFTARVSQLDHLSRFVLFPAARPQAVSQLNRAHSACSRAHSSQSAESHRSRSVGLSKELVQRDTNKLQSGSLLGPTVGVVNDTP